MQHQKPYGHLLISAGAMKAGTTWMYDALQSHPAIHFCEEKETHYFYAKHCRPGLLSNESRLKRAKRYLSFDPSLSAPEVLERRMQWVAKWLAGPVSDDWFRELYSFKGEAKWAAEFSNFNALLPEHAWQEILSRSESLRVIYTLREPIDRLWSHVRFHLKFQGTPDALDDWDVDQTEHYLRHGGDFLDHTDYVTALTRMRRALPRECLRVQFFDGVRSDPQGFLDGIHTFLGVEQRSLPERLVNRVVNPSPPRAIPEALIERLADFKDQQIAGLQKLGIEPPTSWA